MYSGASHLAYLLRFGQSGMGIGLDAKPYPKP